MKLITFISLWVLFSRFLSAQTPEVDWVARYSGPGNTADYARALALDASGNVYVTGEIFSGTSFDYATIKYDASGVQQWVVQYNGTGNGDDEARALAIDASGNVYVTGESFSGTSDDYATIKYDASGVEQWVARYNGPGNSTDYARALALDGSGNVYVTGHSGVYPTFDYATIKYDASGSEEWVARYNGPGNSTDYATALALDGSGNVYVTGWSAGSGTDFDYATIKYDASGSIDWVARYNGPGNFTDNARALALDGSGNVYVTGWSTGSGTDFDYATIKYDASGSEEWVARYNGPGNGYDVATALALDGSGNVYVTGYSVGSSTGGDYATIKYDASGSIDWVARYNGPLNNDDVATALALDGSGNVYVTGWSGLSSPDNDYATIKYDASGIEQWVARYNGPGNSGDYAQALALDGSGNVYVTGYSKGSGTNFDYATIKYTQTGTVPCEEIDLFAAKCDTNGSARAMVRLLHSTEYAGHTVEFQLDDTDYPVELITNGVHTIGRLEVPLVGYGQHTMTLTNPLGCYDPISFNCQVDAEKADPEFDALWAEFDAQETSGTESLPERTRLIGNFPNPFNPVTTISYELPVNTHVTLAVTDIIGREVARLVDGYQEAGYKNVSFDASNLASGIYFYRLQADGFVETRKLILMK